MLMVSERSTGAHPREYPYIPAKPDWAGVSERKTFFADLPPGVARARKTVLWTVFTEQRAGRPWEDARGKGEGVPGMGF